MNRAAGRRVVVVNDMMQKGYRYRITAPAGRNFDPEFRPQLTPKEMLAGKDSAKHPFAKNLT